MCHLIREKKMAGREKGFTLVELMIVVVILGVLASIAIPRFIKLVNKAKITEAKTILRQIIDLETTYYQINSSYVAFIEGQDCAPIAFNQPDQPRRFEYKFDIIGAAPFAASIATATEAEDVNADLDTDDGLTLSVEQIRGVVNNLYW